MPEYLFKIIRIYILFLDRIFHLNETFSFDNVNNYHFCCKFSTFVNISLAHINAQYLRKISFLNMKSGLTFFQILSNYLPSRLT